MAPDNEAVPHVNKGNKQQFSISLRMVVVILLLIIGAMLVMWKPWENTMANARTIEVNGDAKLTAQPDEFVFYPSYTFKNTDKDAALAELTKKSDEITAELKELGVSENKIKTDSNGGAYNLGIPKENGANSADISYTLQFTITVGDMQLAQKVQDYLVGTSPAGVVSPQANFSDAKRKELEDKARVEALKDAKTKADQTAKELGFKVDKVKTVTDGSFSIFPVTSRGMEAADSLKSLAIHAGENELPYSVTVTYFIH
jgi:uncharacterized protein